MKTADSKNSRPSEDEHQEDSPKKAYASQGHATDKKGTATNSKEPSLRASTTDSSRAPKNPNDDLPTGGNVR